MDNLQIYSRITRNLLKNPSLLPNGIENVSSYHASTPIIGLHRGQALGFLCLVEMCVL